MSDESQDVLLAANDEMFATGVFLQPFKVKINGTGQWRWVAVWFEDDSYLNGELVNPIEYADNLDGLMSRFEDDEVESIADS